MIKYRGGKSKEIPHIMWHIPRFSGRYVEPFFGGGALYFYQSENVDRYPTRQTLGKPAENSFGDNQRNIHTARFSAKSRIELLHFKGFES